MDISSIAKLQGADAYQGIDSKAVHSKNNNATFETLFQSALDMVNETNNLINNAEEVQMKFAVGLEDNPLDVQAANQKASVSLQYTVAVRNSLLDAYREIMNMQF